MAVAACRGSSGTDNSNSRSVPDVSATRLSRRARFRYKSTKPRISRPRISGSGINSAPASLVSWKDISRRPRSSPQRERPRCVAYGRLPGWDEPGNIRLVSPSSRATGRGRAGASPASWKQRSRYTSEQDPEKHGTPALHHGVHNPVTAPARVQRRRLHEHIALVPGVRRGFRQCRDAQARQTPPGVPQV